MAGLSTDLETLGCSRWAAAAAAAAAAIADAVREPTAELLATAATACFTVSASARLQAKWVPGDGIWAGDGAQRVGPV